MCECANCASMRIRVVHFRVARRTRDVNQLRITRACHAILRSSRSQSLVGGQRSCHLVRATACRATRELGSIGGAREVHLRVCCIYVYSIVTR